MEGKHSGALSSARLSMKVGDLVRWQSWDKRERVGLIVRMRRLQPAMTLWAYMHTGEALKADDLEVINESR